MECNDRMLTFLVRRIKTLKRTGVQYCLFWDIGTAPTHTEAPRCCMESCLLEIITLRNKSESLHLMLADK